MKKTRARLAALMLCVLSFMSCAQLYHGDWPRTGDYKAEAAQELLDSTVKVRESTTYALKNLVVDLKTKTVTVEIKRTPAHSSSGSGVVVSARRSGKEMESLVITAAHVCLSSMIRPIIVKELKGYTPDITVLDVLDTNGDSHSAEIVSLDVENDVCALSVDGVPGNPVALARSAPPVGGVVSVTGAPMGVFGHRLGYYVEGRYMGETVTDDSEKRGVFALGVTNGNSGGPAFYRGRVVSIVVSTDQRGTMAFGPVHREFVKFVSESEKEWRAAK